MTELTEIGFWTQQTTASASGPTKSNRCITGLKKNIDFLTSIT
jgi:hypothetical protein